MKTSELIGVALDQAVARCEGVEVLYLNDGITECLMQPNSRRFAPSINWAQGGAILEREWIGLTNIEDKWTAEIADDVPDGYITTQGETPLIAAMRCYVTSKLGDEINVPEGLNETV